MNNASDNNSDKGSFYRVDTPDQSGQEYQCTSPDVQPPEDIDAVTECAICTDSLDDTKQYISLPCHPKHCYHVECLKTSGFFAQCYKCPACRQDYHPSLVGGEPYIPITYYGNSEDDSEGEQYADTEDELDNHPALDDYIHSGRVGQLRREIHREREDRQQRRLLQDNENDIATIRYREMMGGY